MGILSGALEAGYVLLSLQKRRSICARLNKCRRQLAKATGKSYEPYMCGSIFSTRADPLLDPLSSEKPRGGGRRTRKTKKARKAKKAKKTRKTRKVRN